MRFLVASCIVACCASVVHADAPPERDVRKYFEAFARKRLISVQTADVRELRRQLAEAEQLQQDGHDRDAALLLFDVTKHPRYAEYADLEELSAAHYALGSALHALGAEPQARVELRKVLTKGPKDRYFSPAFRRYVDVALASGPSAALVAELRASTAEPLPPDALDELAYLSARERQTAGDLAAAKSGFEAISTRSRFHVNALYELGVLAAKERAFAAAEARFCKIASAGDDRHFAFYVDGRYFRLKDLARLGLGRVAHEQGRGDDAFYYYFQVPTDSERVPEALFEAAYARYEAQDAEGAADLLDQLEARFPHSVFADEAAVLRGYVALARCDYEAADRHFTHFDRQFTPMLRHIERLLRNPARRAALYETLRAPRELPASGQGDRLTRDLLTLLRVDPEFDALHASVAQLDREAASSGRLAESYGLLAARYAGHDRPRVAAKEEADPFSVLRQQFVDARQALRALTEQLDAMRKYGAGESELATLERTLAELATRQRQLELQLTAAERSRASSALTPPASGSSDEVSRLLAQDVVHAHEFDGRVLEVRPALLQAANQRALRELQALRDRLASFLRRARIGRIDATMGSKRRIEHQIESLAAGRFPDELQDPLRVQGFLGDDEEYWPFEGEDWPDEYEDNAAPPPARGAKR